MIPNSTHPFDFQGLQQALALLLQPNAFRGESLVQMIEGRQVAKLEQLQIYKPDIVAKGCVDMVEKYPEEVMVLLANTKVAAAAKELLLSMGKSNDPSNEKKMEALGMALLDVGHAMDLGDDAWPENVRKLLMERGEARHAYWQGKREKFEGVPSKGGLKVFAEEGKPFLSKNLGRSTGILLDKLQEDGKPFSRHQLAHAVQFHPKTLLKDINIGNVSRLKHGELVQACVNARQLRGLSSVHCTSLHGSCSKACGVMSLKWIASRNGS